MTGGPETTRPSDDEDERGEPEQVVSGEAAGLTTLLRAALPSVPVVGRLPGIRKVGHGNFRGLAASRPAVQIRREQVQAYAAVCGFPRKDTVPVTYPHLLAFPLHMAIMSAPAFPAPAIGMVHLANSVIAQRAIGLGEILAVRARVGPPRRHPKGRLYEFVTEVREGDADGAVVWQSTSSYLRRGRPEAAQEGSAHDNADSTLPSVTPPAGGPSRGAAWRLPADLGRRYAGVSGDHNPIHLYPLTARALGFRRQIAHGMWSKARCVAAVENRLPEAVRIEVVFKKPIFLPGTVQFTVEPAGSGYAFALTDPHSGALHLGGAAGSP